MTDITLNSFKASLNKQITSRLLIVSGFFFLFWTISIIFFYMIALHHYQNFSKETIYNFYLTRIAQIEENWQANAFTFKTNLELLDIFHQKKDWQNLLNNYLTLLGEDSQFDRIRVLDQNNSQQYDSLNNDPPVQELVNNHDDYLWYFDPIKQKLFWVIQIPIWLTDENNHGMGHLQLFKGMDNRLLFNNNYPYSHLHLFWRGSQVAYSNGIEIADDSSSLFMNKFESKIPWIENKDDVVLMIHQTLLNPINIWVLLTIVYFTLIFLGGIIILFLFNWLNILTQRIQQLWTIAKNFIDDYLLPPPNDLDLVRTQPDELTELANMLENLIRTVQQRDAERDRNERELNHTQQILEIHQQQLEELVISRTKLLEISEEKIRLILDCNAAGIFGTDDDDRITFINPAACKMLGYRAEEVINQCAHTIFHHSHEDGSHYAVGECPMIHSLLNGEVYYSRRELFWRADGKKFPITYASQPIWKNNAIIGSVVSFFDISEQIKVEEALRESMLEAQRLERVKSNFLASMSHEIRTPMNAIIGFTELALQDPMLRSMTQAHLHTILKSAQALLEIINDILDISKLESGRFSLENVCFNIHNMLQNVLETVQQHAHNKCLTLNLEIKNRLPRHCLADPIRLRQILLNLLDNAIKFTERGGITIMVQSSSEPAMYHFSVHDTGIGMSADQIEKIFEPFTQADQSITRRFGGTGLGTTLARQIVELMGGKIWVESQIAIGSIFHFTVNLPTALDVTDCLYDNDDKPITEYTAPRRFRILLAEDQEENATLVKLRLQQYGHNITWVKNGREVIDSYLHDHFDLILMDVMMPKVDGLAATQEIRKIEKEINPNVRIPIIALTASVMHEDNQNCMKVGMNAVIAKPIEFNKLLLTMEQITPEHAGRPNLAPLPKQNFCHCPAELDFSVLRGIVDYSKAIQVWRDPLFYARALISFATSHANDIDQLLLAELDKENNLLERKLIHSLKGLAGNLFLTKVADLTTEIDTTLGMRNKVDLSKINELRQALEEAFNAIQELCLPEEDSQSLAESSPVTVNRILEHLLEELDGINPDTIEPVLVKLASYIDNTKLNPIWQCLNNFDFDGARELTQKLFLS